MKRFAIAAVLSLASFGAWAIPISYIQLQNATSVHSEISPFAGSSDNLNAEYFRFYTGGGSVTVDGSRIDGGYDMAFWLFAGLFADTNAFGSSFDTADAGYIGFYDDVTSPAVPGPYGDPLFSGQLAAGWYTVAVTNFSSNGQTGPDSLYDFRLAATNIRSVPEPLALSLLGLGLAAAAFARRRD